MVCAQYSGHMTQKLRKMLTTAVSLCLVISVLWLSPPAVADALEASPHGESAEIETSSDIESEPLLSGDTDTEPASSQEQPVVPGNGPAELDSPPSPTAQPDSPDTGVSLADPEPLLDLGGPVLNAISPVARSAADEAQILTAVNAARISACVPILYRNPAIDTVARAWSTQMATSGSFMHNPNYRNQIPAGWTAAGENIAAGSPSGYYMFEMWMASSAHRGNMLNPEYTDIGIGFVRGGTTAYGSHGTQNFASYAARRGGAFLDVRPWSDFYSEIQWMSTSRLSTGITVPGCTTAKTYAPKDRVSREAMAAFLYRLSGASYTPPKVSPFVDVKPSDPFYKEITWMYHAKLTTGIPQPTGKPKYAPKDRVSREAMAAFLYRLPR